MTKRGARLFWATVLGFTGGVAAVGLLLHRRSQWQQEPASERAERLLQNCQEQIRRIEQQLGQTQDGRPASDATLRSANSTS